MVGDLIKCPFILSGIPNKEGTLIWKVRLFFILTGRTSVSSMSGRGLWIMNIKFIVQMSSLFRIWDRPRSVTNFLSSWRWVSLVVPGVSPRLDRDTRFSWQLFWRARGTVSVVQAGLRGVDHFPNYRFARVALHKFWRLHGSLLESGLLPSRRFLLLRHLCMVWATFLEFPPSCWRPGFAKPTSFAPKTIGTIQTSGMVVLRRS